MLRPPGATPRLRISFGFPITRSPDHRITRSLGGAPMKRSKTKKPTPASFALVERKLPHRKFVEFTEMQGRTVEKIELFTSGEYHSVSINFQDKTALHLRIDPCFT